jgi:predicted nucleic acid-binding protein
VSLFVDTSALLALLDRGDRDHGRTAAAWRAALAGDDEIWTSSYVLVELTALAQSRLGVPAVRLFETEIVPALRVDWVGEDLHRAAMSALLTAAKRALSLVDCVSFEVMRRRGIRRVLTLDADFGRQGFDAIPS